VRTVAFELSIASIAAMPSGKYEPTIATSADASSRPTTGNTSAQRL